MAISQYRVGDIPQRPLAITVREANGGLANCARFTDFEVVMLGSDNESINVSGGVLNTDGKQFGKFSFIWPTDRSLFTKSGDYVLQLRMKAAGSVEHTTAHVIRVRALGEGGR